MVLKHQNIHYKDYIFFLNYNISISLFLLYLTFTNKKSYQLLKTTFFSFSVNRFMVNKSSSNYANDKQLH